MPYNVFAKHEFEKNFNQLNIELHRTGYAYLNTSWSTANFPSPEAQPYSKLYYVKKGSATIYYNDTEVKLTPRNIYLIPTNLPVHYQADEIFEKLYFHFVISIETKIDLLLGFDKIYQMPISEKRIDKLIEAYRSDAYSSAFFLKYSLMEDIYRLIKDTSVFSNSMKKYDKIVEDALNYIDKNLSANLTVTKLAEVLHISKSTLSYHFKTNLEKTVSEYIDELLMVRAMDFLLTSDLSIFEISQTLGFCDQFYFSKKFKIFFEESPYSCRKRRLLPHNQNK